MVNEVDWAKAFPTGRENLYKLFIESVKDYALFMLDPTGRVITWNAGAERIKGYTAGEIIGQHFSRFYPEADQQRAFPRQILDIATREGRFEHEGWRIRKDGTYFWANVIISAVRDEQGQLLGFSKVTRDLTERKNLEEKLIQSNQALKQIETRYRLLIEGVQDYAIFMLTPEGTIATWNMGAQRIKGYQAEQIIGKHFSIFYPREVVENGFPAYELQKALADGRFEDEGWRVRRDGSLFWANVVITPLYNEEQVHIGYSKITRNLSQRVRNEELMKKNRELLQVNKDLNRINSELDNFIYTASHDLKAPIVNIEGLLKALFGQLDEGSIRKERVQQIYQLLYDSVNSFKSTIQDLTQVAQVSKEVSEDVGPVPFAQLLQEVILDLIPQITESEAEVNLELACEEVQFSRKNLKRILYNLLSNALKYRSPDRRPVILIRCWEEDFYIKFSVEDNGLGIPEAGLGKIFSLFKRLHNHVEGSGIGLFIVKKIIEDADGKIEVESQSGIGTTFTVSFKQQV